MRTWLRNALGGRLAGARPRPSSVVRRRRPRLDLEKLEDRATPAVGSLDPTFGSGGLVFTDLLGDTDSGNALHFQQGQLLVAGSAFNADMGREEAFLARYDASGSLDTSFGTGGIALINAGVNSVVFWDFAVQGDNKIVAVGHVSNSGATETFRDFVVARFNSDGSLDTSFGGDGVINTDLAGRSDQANSVVIQSDGKIVVAGRSNLGGDSDFAIARYNDDGSLDTGFGADGVVLTNFGTADDQAQDVAQDSNGRLVVTGFSASNATVARYLADGSLDSGFGFAGMVSLFNCYTTTVEIDPSGAILVGGNLKQNTTRDMFVARLTASGALDTAFGGGDGVASVDFGGTYEAVTELLRQADGTIVGAGFTNPDGGFTNFDFGVFRLTASGDLDASFNDDGKVLTDLVNGIDFPSGLVVQPDGKIVVAGSSGSGDVALARYLIADLPTTPNAGGPYNISEGQDLTLSAASTSNPDNDPLVYHWDINGDGNFNDLVTLVPSVTLSWGQLKALGITGGPGLLDNVRVLIDNGFGSVVTSTAVSLTVSNTPPSVTLDQTAATLSEGDTLSRSGSATDPGGDSLTATVDYGDGSGTAALTLNGTSFDLQHQFQDNGTFTVTVTVTDSDGASTTTSFQVTVNNVAPTADAGADRTVRVGDAVTIDGQLTDPGSLDTHTFSWTVVDGGGNTVASGTGQNISLTPSAPGTYIATFTVTDDDGGVGTDEATITVGGRPIIVTGAAHNSRVRVFDAETKEQSFNSPAFGGSRIGVRVAAGDVTGDDIPDIVVAQAPGGGRVAVFDGATGDRLQGTLGGFQPYGARFKKGIFVAVGDLNSDGNADIITGTDRGVLGEIHAYSGADGSELFPPIFGHPGFKGGVRVAAGDVNGDGNADIIVTGGKGGTGQVHAFSGSSGQMLLNFAGFGSNFVGAAQVATGDVNGDGKDDIIVSGQTSRRAGTVRVFSGADGSQLAETAAAGAAHVGVTDTDGDGSAEVLVGPVRGASVRILNGMSLAQLDSLFAFNSSMPAGVFVGGSVL